MNIPQPFPAFAKPYLKKSSYVLVYRTETVRMIHNIIYNYIMYINMYIITCTISFFAPFGAVYGKNKLFFEIF